MKFSCTCYKNLTKKWIKFAVFLPVRSACCYFLRWWKSQFTILSLNGELVGIGEESSYLKFCCMRKLIGKSKLRGKRLSFKEILWLLEFQGSSDSSDQSRKTMERWTSAKRPGKLNFLTSFSTLLYSAIVSRDESFSQVSKSSRSELTRILPQFSAL